MKHLKSGKRSPDLEHDAEKILGKRIHRSKVKGTHTCVTRQVVRIIWEYQGRVQTYMCVLAQIEQGCNPTIIDSMALHRAWKNLSN